MKILILSFPFCGASALAASLAHTLGYKYFQDPLSLDRPINITHPNEDFVQTIPRGHNLEYNGWDKETGFHEYVHPNEVEDNTIITHNVLWHKLPSNQNEATFLSHFRAKFDYIICLGSRILKSKDMFSLINYFLSTKFEAGRHQKRINKI